MYLPEDDAVSPWYHLNLSDDARLTSKRCNGRTRISLLRFQETSSKMYSQCAAALYTIQNLSVPTWDCYFFFSTLFSYFIIAFADCQALFL